MVSLPDLFPRRPPRFAVLPPTAPGSLGDQAMLDAACTRLSRAGATAVFPHAPALRGDTRLIARAGRKSRMRAALAAIAGASHVALIGADMIDGRYSRKASRDLFRALLAAHRLGRRTRIFGASWSTAPDPVLRDTLRRARWLEILARDPASQARMEADFDRPVPLVADLAFLLTPELRTEAARAAVRWIETGAGPVMGVCLSGHAVEAGGGDVGPYADLVAAWLDADPGRRVLVFFHDTRRGMVGDIEVNRALAARLAPRFGDRVRLVDAALDAWDVKAMLACADLTLTGRMHCAIASLGAGTPAVCSVYMDKFEGLMRHFGLEGMTFAPDRVDRAALGVLERASLQAPETSARITAALPRIREMSEANFAGFAAG